MKIYVALKGILMFEHNYGFVGYGQLYNLIFRCQLNIVEKHKHKIS